MTAARPIETTRAVRRKRTPDTGLVRPYRPKPANFRQIYIEMGWDGLDEHFHTNWRVIRRWIIEQIVEDEASGRITLKVARANFLAEHGVTIRRHEVRGSRRSDYVSGRRMRAGRSFDWGNIPPRAQLNLILEDGMYGYTAPGEKQKVRVSDHARVKFLERVVGIDMGKLDAQILSPTIELADSFGAEKVIMSNGHKAVVRGGVVVTIEEKPKRRPR